MGTCDYKGCKKPTVWNDACEDHQWDHLVSPTPEPQNIKQILEKILQELEIKRSGEVPRTRKTLTLDGESFEVTEITEDFAKGFTEGKNLAIEIITDYLQRQK